MRLSFVAITVATVYLSSCALAAGDYSDVQRAPSKFDKQQSASSFVPRFHKRSGAALPNGVEPSAGCKACNSSLSFAGEKAKEYEVGTQM